MPFNKILLVYGVLAGEIQMTSQWIRVSSKLRTGAFIGRWGELDTETQGEDRSKDWNDIFTSQRMVRLVGKHQMLGQAWIWSQDSP